MNKIITPLIYLLLSCPLLAQINPNASSEDVEGLGKVERIQRLEKIVNDLQSEVKKLAAGPGAAAGGSGASKSTYVQFSDLLQVKTELTGSLEREVGQMKISLSRSKQSIDKIESSLERLKESSVKDIEFKLTALQKSFEALENSLREQTSN